MCTDSFFWDRVRGVEGGASSEEEKKEEYRVAVESEDDRLEDAEDDGVELFPDDFMEDDVEDADDDTDEEMVDDVPNDCQPLTTDERAFVRRMCRSSFRITQQRSDYVLTTARIKELMGLADAGWLNDDTINAYMHLLRERCTRNQKKYAQEPQGDEPLNAFFVMSFLCPSSAGVTPATPDGAHRCWIIFNRFHKRLGLDIAKQPAKIFYPFHLGGHWMLFVVDMYRKRFEFYNSFGPDSSINTDSSSVLNFKNFLLVGFNKLADAAGVRLRYNFDEWVLHDGSQHCPEQEDESACGVFTCQFAKYLSLHKRAEGLTRDTFTQAHTPYLRKSMVVSLLRDKRID